MNDYSDFWDLVRKVYVDRFGYMEKVEETELAEPQREAIPPQEVESEPYTKEQLERDLREVSRPEEAPPDEASSET